MARSHGLATIIDLQRLLSLPKQPQGARKIAQRLREARAQLQRPAQPLDRLLRPVGRDQRVGEVVVEGRIAGPVVEGTREQLSRGVRIVRGKRDHAEARQRRPMLREAIENGAERGLGLAEAAGA